MAYPRTIRSFNAFVDGESYFGKVTEAVLPKLELETSSHRGAGMDSPIEIDMGMKGMTSELTIVEHRPELITLFGTKQRMVLRPGAMGEDSFDSVDSYIATIGGRWTMVDQGTLKQGSDTFLKLTCSVDYYRLELNGTELVEIDVENGTRVIGGTDQLAALRKAMGL